VIKVDGSSGGAKDFVWLEGVVDATGDDAGVSMATVRFSVLAMCAPQVRTPAMRIPE